MKKNIIMILAERVKNSLNIFLLHKAINITDEREREGERERERERDRARKRKRENAIHKNISIQQKDLFCNFWQILFLNISSLTR